MENWRKLKEIFRKKAIKQNEINEKRDIVIEKNEESRELKQYEQSQSRKNATEEENTDLGRFFQLTTSKEIYVNQTYSHEIRIEILLNHTGAFERIGSNLTGEIE